MVNDWPIINLFFNQRKVENMKDNGKDDIPYMKWKRKTKSSMYFWDFVHFCLLEGYAGNPGVQLIPIIKNKAEKGVTTYDLPRKTWNVEKDSGKW
jgi:hypothetical protein